MASLAEQFLDDLESSDNDRNADAEDGTASEEAAPAGNPSDGDVEMTPREDGQGPSETELQKRLDAVLLRVAKYEKLPASESEVSSAEMRTDDDSEYAFVVKCIQIVAEIEAQVGALYRRLRDVYSIRFPELETLILNPLDYGRIVRLAGNAEDFAKVDLASILPSGTVITVQVTASSTAGRLLSQSEAEQAHFLSTSLLKMDKAKSTILSYVESRAAYMAPNLTVVVGGAVAATLLGLAGGICELAYMPSCNLKVLGKPKRTLQGASSQTVKLHQGVVFTCPLVANLPPALRAKGGDVVAGKATLAARVDASGEKRDGSVGRSLKEQLEKKFETWQEPPPAKTLKPLPVPGEQKRRHRGGKRARKEKERLGLTDVRKLANRVKFGEAEEVYGNDLEHEGFGMLGAEGSRRLRVQTKKTDTLSVAATRKLSKQRRRERKRDAAALGAATSLAFTPVQGIELGAMTPAPGGVGLGSMDAHDGTKSNYFSSATPFVGIKGSSQHNR